MSATGEVITFDDNYTITLTTEELTISQGSHHHRHRRLATPSFDGKRCSGYRNLPCLQHFTNGTVILQNMTIRNGNPSSERGGGIYNSATLTVDNCTISDNTANSAGGGIWNDGTINALSNSTIIGNTANSEGGGIYNFEYSTISSLSNSTISGNRADNGGGIFNSDYSTINALSNSTIIGNTANSAGGGIYNFGGIEISDYSTINALSNSTISGNTANSAGGGIYNYNSTINALSNSTISGNTAENGGGIFNYNGTINALSNSTISGNTATKNGGGISNPYSYGLISLANSIVINNNSGSDSGTDILNSGTLNAYYSWYNQVSGTINTQETAPNVTSSYSEGNLGELADNGGPTWTMAVTSGPAYQTGQFVYYNITDGYYIYDNQTPTPVAHKVADWSASPSNAQASDKITTDQRGVVRTAGQNTSIGAYSENYVSAYYYRSNATTADPVDWSLKTTWQQSADGLNWEGADAAPDQTSLGTTIVNGDTVTVDQDVTTDQTTVASGGTLTVASSQTLTIANGDGTDLTVEGSLTNAGTLTCADGTEVLFSGASDSPISGAGTWTFKTLTLNKDAAATRLDINTGSDVTVETALAVTRGTVDLSGWTHNLLLGGSLSIAENGRWAKHSDSTYYLKFYDTDCTFTDSSTGGPQNLGHVKVDE